jgi:hypothetical protein
MKILGIIVTPRIKIPNTNNTNITNNIDKKCIMVFYDIYHFLYRRQDSNLRDINAKGYEPSPIVHSGTTVLVAGQGVEPCIHWL